MILQMLAQESTAPVPGLWEGNALGIVGVWVGVGFTLMLYTFLYKDNPLFKFAEHVYVGVTNGWLIWQAWFSSVKNDLAFPLGRLIKHDIFQGDVTFKDGDTWWLLVPFALSLFMLLRFIPKATWLSRWSFAFIVGVTAGTLIPLTVQGQLFQQMQPMLESPIKWQDGHFSFMGTLSALLTVLGVLTVLTYFVFSIEHKGPVKKAARTGVAFLMIAFGAHFGYTVMGRESLLIERIQYLLQCAHRDHPVDAPKGTPNPHYATLVLFFLVVASVAAIEIAKNSRRAAEGPGPVPEEPPAAPKA